MKKIYFAGPLFTLAEREFNEKLSRLISERLNNRFVIVLPQTFSEKYPKDEHFFHNLFLECIRGIEEADMVIAILDGSDSDSGTCVEIGYAYAKNKPVIGVRTDFRISEDRGLNLMVSQLCTELILEPAADMCDLAAKIAEKLCE